MFGVSSSLLRRLEAASLSIYSAAGVSSVSNRKLHYESLLLLQD